MFEWKGILLDDEKTADAFMKSIKESELKPYTEEQREKDDKRIEGIMSLCKKLTKEQVTEIFTYGMNYMLARKQPELDFGQFPTDNFQEAIDYVYRLIVENERDEECLRCQRYYSKSCVGTINRGREVITEGNRCAAFILKEEDLNEEKNKENT